MEPQSLQSSSTIIKSLEKHFSCQGIPETLRADNGSNLVSQEMEEFLDEVEIKHKRTDYSLMA